MNRSVSSRRTNPSSELAYIRELAASGDDEHRSPRRSLLRTEPMALERQDILELMQLAERQLEELRALRDESARQTELPRQLLARLESLERTQYS
jgi:hypothetical protein